MTNLLENYKLKRKRRIFEEEIHKISFDDLEHIEDFLEEIKSKWFNMSIDKKYKKDLLQEIVPILRKLKTERDSKILEIRNNYDKLLDKEKKKIENNFLKDNN